MGGVELGGVYSISENVVAREIEGALIIVPVTCGVGDLEGALFSLNDTGRAVWERLDGKTALEDIVADLVEEYEADRERIVAGVLALVERLVGQGMVNKMV